MERNKRPKDQGQSDDQIRRFSERHGVTLTTAERIVNPPYEGQSDDQIRRFSERHGVTLTTAERIVYPPYGDNGGESRPGLKAELSNRNVI